MGPIRLISEEIEITHHRAQPSNTKTSIINIIESTFSNDDLAHVRAFGGLARAVQGLTQRDSDAMTPPKAHTPLDKILP